MARSLKKGPYVFHALEKKVQKNIDDNSKSVDQSGKKQPHLVPTHENASELAFRGVINKLATVLRFPEIQ